MVHETHGDGLVSVAVCAFSRESAEELVRELLGRVNAQAVEIVAPDLAFV